MSTLSAKDRLSLCSFTFSDGRRCRTPRFANHPRFCPYHAQKEARARAAETLGKDLAYFFSGNYLSACDLSTALGCLIPAVIRGDVKPKTAHTVAYLLQTLLQAIHISQHEYGEAFGGDGWRKAIRNSVNHNLGYRFPPAPQSGPAPDQPAPSAPSTNPRSAASAPRTNLRGEEPAFSSSSAPSPTSARAPRTPASPVSPASPSSPICHPERSEGSDPSPATQPAPSVAPIPRPAYPEQRPRVNPREPDRSAPWLNPGLPIPPDSKLL